MRYLVGRAGSTTVPTSGGSYPAHRPSSSGPPPGRRRSTPHGTGHGRHSPPSHLAATGRATAGIRTAGAITVARLAPPPTTGRSTARAFRRSARPRARLHRPHPRQHHHRRNLVAHHTTLDNLRAASGRNEGCPCAADEETLRSLWWAGTFPRRPKRRELGEQKVGRGKRSDWPGKYASRLSPAPDTVRGRIKHDTLSVLGGG